MADKPASKTAVGLGAAATAIVAAFLVTWEGYEPVAKHESVDPPGVITWCFGRTNYDDSSVKVGERFSKEECEKFLAEDLPRYTEPLRKCIPAFDAMPPQRQAALVSFSYNLGPATVCHSSAVRELNAGNVKAGCDAMLLYNKVNGHVCDDAHCGLGRRRRAERDLCMKSDVIAIPSPQSIPPEPKVTPKEQPKAAPSLWQRLLSFFKKGN